MMGPDNMLFLIRGEIVLRGVRNGFPNIPQTESMPFFVQQCFARLLHADVEGTA